MSINISAIIINKTSETKMQQNISGLSIIIKKQIINVKIEQNVIIVNNIPAIKKPRKSKIEAKPKQP